MTGDCDCDDFGGLGGPQERFAQRRLGTGGRTDRRPARPICFTDYFLPKASATTFGIEYCSK